MESFPIAVLVGAIAAALAFFIGRRGGAASEREQQQRSRTTAEETATRLLDEAKREAETLRKGAVVAGKEELIQLREDFEGEVRRRRTEVERDERRVQDREDQLTRRADGLDGRESELAVRVGDWTGATFRSLSARKKRNGW